MSRREEVLTEIGIERWRLRGVARPTVESETHSSYIPAIEKIGVSLG